MIEEYDPDTTPSRLRSYVYGSYVDDPLVMAVPDAPDPDELYYYTKNARAGKPVPPWAARLVLGIRGGSYVDDPLLMAVPDSPNPDRLHYY